MCVESYKKFGSPEVFNVMVFAARDLVRKVYKHNCVGGNLHIVLDDWNLENESLRFCQAEINKAVPNVTVAGESPRGPGETDESLKAEQVCLDAFFDLSVDERATVLALHNELIPVPGKPEWKVYHKIVPVKARQMDEEFGVQTPEGFMRGQKGDYLCTNMEESHEWPVKRDIFEATYEELNLKVSAVCPSCGRIVRAPLNPTYGVCHHCIVKAVRIPPTARDNEAEESAEKPAEKV